MKNALIVLIFIGLALDSHAQLLNQDADGNSTIVAKGGAVGIDISKASIQLDYLRYSVENKSVVWGVGVLGKNSDGVAPLFSGSKIVPEAGGYGILGYKESKIHFPEKEVQKKIDALEAEKLQLADEYNDQLEYVDSIYDAMVDAIITTECPEVGALHDIKEKLKHIDNWINKSEEIQTQLDAWLTEGRCPESNGSSLFNQIERLKQAVDRNPVFQKFSKIEQRLEEISKENTKIQDEYNHFSILLLPYLKTGISTSSYINDLGTDSTSVDSRFDETIRHSFKLELGISAKVALFRFGLSLGLHNVDNLESLKKRTFQFSEIDSTIQDGILSQIREITASNGTLTQYNKFAINWDVMKLWPMPDEEHYIGLSGYCRANIPMSKAQDIPAAKTKLGISLNFFDASKGKFLGGTYLESKDLFNESENGFVKNLQFGLTAKIAFSGFDF